MDTHTGDLTSPHVAKTRRQHGDHNETQTLAMSSALDTQLPLCHSSHGHQHVMWRGNPVSLCDLAAVSKLFTNTRTTCRPCRPCLPMTLHGCDATWGGASLKRHVQEENTATSNSHHNCHMQIDSCGVRTHALADWRLKPAP